MWKRRLVPSPLWDGLAFGGVACYAAYLYLRIRGTYYLAPVDLIALLYVGRFTYLSWRKMRLVSKLTNFVLASTVLLQGITLSSFILYEKVNVRQADAKLASTILDQSESAATPIKRLYFPFSGGYSITEFTSYLVYRGLQIEGYETKAHPSSRNTIMIVSPNFAKDGPCFVFRGFICHPGAWPAPNDLVVELPTDLESLSDVNVYSASGQTLVAFQPCPRFPKWMYPVLGELFDVFRASTPGLPDRWLHASVLKAH